jgi:SAM-dependent methyltransferase
MNEKINIDEVKLKFNALKDIWAESDRWHKYTSEKIKEFLLKYTPKYFTKDSYLLNAGSGGNDYGIIYKQMHVDIAENKLKHVDLFTVSDICNLPFTDALFDGCICVGSVLNYCDLIPAIQELSRVIKPNGYLFLEYESSRNFEFLWTEIFNANAAICQTFYQGTKEKLWVYSPRYFNQVINVNNLKIFHIEPFHIASSMIYPILKKEKISSLLSVLDPLLSRFPFVKNYSSNIILICQKKLL